MADANIPAWLAALQAQQAPMGGSGWSPGATYTDPTTGAVYGQQFSTSSNGGGQGENNTTAQNGYWGMDAANAALDADKKKSLLSSYDTTGNKMMDYINDPKDGLTPQQWALMMAAAIAGGYGLNAALGGAAGGAGGAGYGIVGGATEPVTSLAMGAGEMGAGGAAGAIGTMPSLAPLSTSIADVGALPTMAGAGSTILDGVKQYGGPIAAVLGGAMGAEGQKTSTTTDRKTDPRVDPYLFGGNGAPGLLGYTQQQLARDMSPERRAQIDSMLSKGMGLMNQPVAGNGFNLLTKGKY